MTTPFSTLDTFVAEVGALAAAGDALAVARGTAARLPRLLANPSLLAPEHRRTCEDAYAQHVLHVDPAGRFSVVALVWEPGQATPVHDHAAWCVVGVYEGEDLETRYRLEDGPPGRRLRAIGTARHVRGEVVWLVPDRDGDVHRVSNPTSGTAISIHVYGADIAALGTSIRQRYPLSGGEAGEGEAR